MKYGIMCAKGDEENLGMEEKEKIDIHNYKQQING